MNRAQTRKLIEQLKKMRRVDITHTIRLDDVTAAYYCEETDEIVMFVDVITSDAMTHFKNWGGDIDSNLEDFIAHFLTRTTLHELMHYCGIDDSKQCEYIAARYTWDNEAIGRIVANFQYPHEGKISKIVEIELE